MTDGSARPRVGRFADVPADEPYPGVVRRTFDTDRATVTRYEFAPGARFPLHRHEQEQITLVEHGDVEFAVGGRQQRLAAGDWSVVASGVEHGLTAGDAGARIVAIVVPRRDPARPYTTVTEAE